MIVRNLNFGDIKAHFGTEGIIENTVFNNVIPNNLHVMTNLQRIYIETQVWETITCYKGLEGRKYKQTRPFPQLL